jgi:ComB9 competence protein
MLRIIALCFLVSTAYAENLLPTVENPDIEAHSSGDYPNLSRDESLPLGAIQHAWDNATDSSGVYIVDFKSSKTIKIRAREYMTTSIVFPAWEEIEEVIVGDKSVLITSKPKSNIITIWPQNSVSVDTNITAISKSGHVYPFYVRVEGYNSKNISDLILHIRVPMPPLPIEKKLEQEEKQDYLDEVLFNPSKLDFDFNMAGDKTIAPERVYSDGILTWFDYGDRINKGNIPAIFAVINGVNTPINVSREGSKLVAQATGKFILKRGDQEVCVYKDNE